jgi:hypothetical protein
LNIEAAFFLLELLKIVVWPNFLLLKKKKKGKKLGQTVST